jgi:DNA polymerase III subunit gamma/tau
MSYIPLHHKYRPQTFADLVGQEAIATTLSNAISRQQIAPAYLFTGPRGTGKTSSARILAKSLNCLASDRPNLHPCGKCDVCTKISLGLALDIIEIDAASNTGVDNIREVIERAQFAPVQCRYKVYIIDEVHMLSTAAFNALLKTLEEPPTHVVFILATTDLQRVLPTIISRCQRYNFQRISLGAMVPHLQKIADLEKIKLTPSALTLVAQVAQGGLRDAESLLDQLSLLSGEVDEDRVWDLVGAVPERDLLQLLTAIAARSPEATLSQIRQLLERGREPLVVLQQLAGFYRDLSIAKTAPSRGDLSMLTESGWQNLVALAQTWDVETIVWAQQQLKSSEVQLKQTTQPRLWLEVTLLGLLEGDRATSAAPPKTISVVSSPPTAVKLEPVPAIPKREPIVPPPAAAVAIPVELEPVIPASEINSTEPQPVTPTEEIPTAPSTEPESVPVSIEPEPVTPAVETTNSEGVPQVDLEAVWAQAIAHLQPLATQALLNQHCYLLDFDGQSAEIGIKSQPLLKLAQARLPNIEAAFHQIAQQPVRVVFKVAPLGSTPPPPAKKTPPAIVPVETEKVLYAPVVANSAPLTQTTVAEPQLVTVSDLLTADIPPLTAVDLDDNRVINAARSLAQFFDGELLQLGDDIQTNSASDANLALQNSVEANSLEAVAEDDDIDF